MSLDVDVSLHTVPPQQHTVCSNAISTSMLSDSAVPHHNMSSQCCSVLWSWSGPAICVVISIGITHIVHYCHPPIIVLQLTICQPLVIIPSIMVLAITCNLIFVPDGSSSLNILMIIIQIHPPLVSNTLKPSWLVSDSNMVPLSRKTGQVKMFSPIQNAPTLYR